MDFPSIQIPAPPVLTPFHPESLGLAISAAFANGVLGQATSGTWPTANKAFFYPFFLRNHAVAYQLLFWVGATSAGNIDVGVFDSEANLIVAAGSTAMSATVNTIQELNITDTELKPGEYLLGAACSSTSGTVFRISATDESAFQSFPVYEQAGLTSATLTNPAVPVISTEASPPVVACGIQFRSVF